MRIIRNQTGFGAVVIMALVILLSAISFFVYQQITKSTRNQTNTAPTADSSQEDGITSDEQEPQQPGTKIYVNKDYGFSLKYPDEWKVEEVKADASKEPTRATINIEEGVYLKRDKKEKYDTTLGVEILKQNIDEAESVYDQQYAQAPSNPVTKTTNQLKSRRSVQYAFPNSPTRDKLYLFGVDNKTYLFRSVNAELNLQLDSEYWSKFNNVLDSLQINTGNTQ